MTREKNIALLVIYNHRYEQNIPVINEIYKGKFSNIFHVMPFYEGNREDVIPVFENSFYFSGYIAQAYSHLMDKGFTHFFCVADDMIINPVINESNFWETIGIGENDCFLTDFIEFQNLNQPWSRLFDSLNFKLNQPGIEISSVLPSKEEAVDLFNKHRLSCEKIPIKVLDNYIRFTGISNFLRDVKNNLLIIKRYFGKQLNYPLVGGYSDIFLVTSDCMRKFALYCGAFASAKLFVEVAIPTAMALSCDNIKFIHQTKLEAGAMWTKEDFTLINKYNNNLNYLLDEFPRSKFYIHPIKLTKWKFL